MRKSLKVSFFFPRDSEGVKSIQNYEKSFSGKYICVTMSGQILRVNLNFLSLEPEAKLAKNAGLKPLKLKSGTSALKQLGGCPNFSTR